MIMSIYLHKQYADILKCYGSLSDVVNKILDEADAGNIDFMDKPACPDRAGASRYNIDITNETYLELLEIYSINSSKISLRRLIYWFVNNEMYNELGWIPIKEYVDNRISAICKKIDNITSELEHCKKYSKNTIHNDSIINAINMIKELKECIINGREFNYKSNTKS